MTRRNDTTQMSSSELAIYGIMGQVEMMGSDPRLTDAVILLRAARDSIADYIEEKKDVRRFVMTPLWS